MPVWRCPHCATPQTESSRCWVCLRSTTSCATCRHFRRGIAGGLGMCGLDRRHAPLNGTEMRACWASVAPLNTPAERELALVGAGAQGDRDGAGSGARVAGPGGTGRVPRTFVPVESLGLLPEGPGKRGTPETTPATPLVSGTTRKVPGRWWLWGDPEPWPEL